MQPTFILIAVNLTFVNVTFVNLMNIDTTSRTDLWQTKPMASIRESTVATEACCSPLFEAGFNEEAAADMAAVLKALADPVRLRLVSIIGQAENGEVCACDLPAAVDRSQPTVSHHLGQLVAAGLLHREQRGKWAWFRLETDQLERICAAISLGQA